MNTNKVASVILAGGEGTRLFPLTKKRCKPAVSYGGRYRLIDIPISNSLNSHISEVFVLAQHLAGELQEHLLSTYSSKVQGSFRLLSPSCDEKGNKILFSGTADAVRKTLEQLFTSSAEYFLILSGDQLYNIDFQKMLDFAIEKDADLTIASLPVSKEESKRLGILKVDSSLCITDFVEKPQKAEILGRFRLPQEASSSSQKESYLGSMGIYIFKRKSLQRLLTEDNREDFGKHLIPFEIQRGKTFAFIYDGYWEDIGTVSSFFLANLALTQASFNGLKTYDDKNPIFARNHHLPGARIRGTRISDSIICEGSIIEADDISESIIGLRSQIQKGCRIQRSILLGNPLSFNYKGTLDCHIGENCSIKNAIIDEHVSIGNNVTLFNQEGLRSYDGENFYVRDGIIIIPEGAYIPDHFSF